MSKQDRNRKSSPQNLVKSFSNANRMIEPPITMNEHEIERFDAIIVSRDRETWTPTDIFNAARMAQLEVEAIEFRDAYRAEGVRITDHNDKPIINPFFTAYQTTIKAIDNQRRLLGLSASQKGISGTRQAKRNQQDAQAKEKISSLSSLIKRPDGKG